MTCAGVGIADVAMAEPCDEIRRVLVERRRALLNEIQSRVRDAREVGSDGYRHTTDLDDTIDAEPEDDLVFALIQMKAEILERVNEAVRCVDEGTYGCCVDCGDVIAASRLRAMPFAALPWLPRDVRTTAGPRPHSIASSAVSARLAMVMRRASSLEATPSSARFPAAGLVS